MIHRASVSATSSDGPYYLGFDGGGTKIAATVIDDKGSIVFRTRGGPGNVAVLGAEKTFGHLVKIVDSLAEDVPGLLSRVSFMLFGLAGISSAQPELRAELLGLVGAAWNNIPAEVVNDGYLAWFATNKGGPAIAVIRGTGSACIGVDSRNTIIRKGGLGRIVSDQGSGYSIGLTGIRKSIAATQALGAPTALSKLVMREYDIGNLDDAPNRIGDHCEIAAFSKCVYEAAINGDPVAVEIIDQAVLDLTDYVRAVWADGSFDDETLKVGTFGGCLDHMPHLRSKLADALLKFSPNLQVRKPAISPDIAAAEIALSMHRQPQSLPACANSI